jgi:hypothetical protein
MNGTRLQYHNLPINGHVLPNIRERIKLRHAGEIILDMAVKFR